MSFKVGDKVKIDKGQWDWNTHFNHPFNSFESGFDSDSVFTVTQAPHDPDDRHSCMMVNGIKSSHYQQRFKKYEEPKVSKFENIKEGDYVTVRLKVVGEDGAYAKGHLSTEGTTGTRSPGGRSHPQRIDVYEDMLVSHEPTSIKLGDIVTRRGGVYNKYTVVNIVKEWAVLTNNEYPTYAPVVDELKLLRRV